MRISPPFFQGSGTGLSPRIQAPLATHRVGVIQRMGDDDEWMPPQPKGKQERFSFLKATPRNVIESTAHVVKHFDAARFKAVWTCPRCKRMLAFLDISNNFHLSKYGYLSKSGKVHSLRSVTMDHHPTTWAEHLDGLNNSGATKDEKRAVYQDESGLRALCKICNESHEHEGVDIEEYDSSDDDFDPPQTPQHEVQYNSGQFSGYRPAGFFV
ncbi:hypothetical protein [Silvibacterium sp.]|uniref:hypothetical protein n=1 Tax=Silvibacterium sp. TaxID=1964179 RepID=UPI0039E436C0